MNIVEIKNVERSDIDFLFQLMNDTKIMKALNEPPTSKEDWIKAVNYWENDDDELDFIIWNDDKQIGWFAFNGVQSLDKIVYLKMAAILPQYQHKGIGSYVLLQLLEVMKRKGFVKVILFTNQENVTAQKCYQKCGFRIIEELTEKMSDNTLAVRFKMECDLLGKRLITFLNDL